MVLSLSSNATSGFMSTLLKLCAVPATEISDAVSLALKIILISFGIVIFNTPAFIYVVSASSVIVMFCTSLGPMFCEKV